MEKTLTASVQDELPEDSTAPQARPADDAEGSNSAAAAASLLAASLLAACGGGGEDAVRESTQAAAAPDKLGLATGDGDTGTLARPDKRASGTSPPPPATAAFRNAARFLAQATMGPKSVEEINALAVQGLPAWLDTQFALPAFSYSVYLESQRGRDQTDPNEDLNVREEYSYEAVWQHWLRGEDQLRARVVWALLQIMVISNIAPDIRAVAMSSYMDVLGRNAFGNFRTLLQDVTLHPAMGYYLNMLESEKEDPVKGTHPNENYAREVLQLFSIGLVKLNIDGTPQLDGQGRTIPTYNEDVVKGFAKAFSGWAYGGLDNTRRSSFHDHDDNDERLWRVPMIAWPMWHSTATKLLLDGRTLPAGQTAEKDLADALDNIFNHPNVGPFIGRQLIQRLVTSNPSPAYISRVASVFNNNGSGVRGDMKAVIRAILLDAEARADTAASTASFGKQREPVLRFAAFLRGLGATSKNGINNIHYLDSTDDALGQSPLLAPSVFNFYSPFYRPAGPLAAAGLVAPEFQITSETSLVGSLNFFAWFFESGGYGWDDSRLRLNYSALKELTYDTDLLIDRLDRLFCCARMSTGTRDRIRTAVNALPVRERVQRIKSALLLLAMSPDFVIQK